MALTTLETQSQINDLEAKLDARAADMHDLSTMGAVITSMLEINSILSVVMDMALRLVSGEVGIIMLPEGGELAVKVSWGIEGDFARNLMYEDQMDLPSYVYEKGTAVILNDLGITDNDGRSISSIICLPIKTATSNHGVLMIINRSNGDDFDEYNREILEMLLNFVAVAMDNAILLVDKLESQRMEQEMSIAKQIQETILPQDIDDITGVEIGAVYYPARDVGGDFYDIVKIDDDSFICIIGDVSNKGVPAAIVMSAAAGIVRSLIEATPDIAVNDLASKLNNLLCLKIIKDREMFITLFFCKFDLKNDVIEFCNAGHMPGLFWEHEEQKIFELSEGGSIVGQFPDLKFSLGKRSIGSGDRLFLYTDGLTEAADSENRLFGRERAEQVFSTEIGLSPKEFCARVKDWVDNFAAGSAEETHDDFTILQIKVNS